MFEQYHWEKIPSVSKLNPEADLHIAVYWNRFCLTICPVKAFEKGAEIFYTYVLFQCIFNISFHLKKQKLSLQQSVRPFSISTTKPTNTLLPMPMEKLELLSEDLYVQEPWSSSTPKLKWCEMFSSNVLQLSFLTSYTVVSLHTSIVMSACKHFSLKLVLFRQLISPFVPSQVAL